MTIKQVFASEFVKFEITEQFYTVFTSHGLIVTVNLALTLCDCSFASGAFFKPLAPLSSITCSCQAASDNRLSRAARVSLASHLFCDDANVHAPLLLLFACFPFFFISSHFWPSPDCL